MEPYERLREARKRANFPTGAAAATAFGFKQVTYRSHENGTRGFSTEDAARYAKAFKVDAAWLLALGGNPPEGQFVPDIPSGEKSAQLLYLPVTLPSADILTEAFQAILSAGVLPMDDMDSLARALAEEFPAALEGALFRQGQRRKPGGRGPKPPSPEARDNK